MAYNPAMYQTYGNMYGNSYGNYGQQYHAMKDAEEWEDKDASGRSYRRGRDAMGRYTSMDMRGYSGHYMPYPPRYPQSYEYPEEWR